MKRPAKSFVASLLMTATAFTSFLVGPTGASAAPVATGLSAAVPAGCAAVRKENPSVVGKSYTVGTDPEAPPFETINSSGKVVGFDLDVMTEITDCLGAKYSVSQTSFPGLIPGLQAGHIDMVISSLVATPPRLKEVNFVGYLRQQEGLLVPKGNPDHLTTIEDLCGHSVAVMPASLELVFVDAEGAKCVAEGKKAPTAENFTNLTSIIEAIVEGRADCSIIGPPYTTEAVAKFPTKLQATPLIAAFNATVGIALPKKSMALDKALYDALKVIQTSGEEQASMKTWKIAAHLFESTRQLS